MRPSSCCGRDTEKRAGKRLFVGSGSDLLSRAVTSQVPSTHKGLTSVFGMGTGGSPSPLPPENDRVWNAALLPAASAFAPARQSASPAHPENCTPSLPTSRALQPISLRSLALFHVGLSSNLFLDQALDRLVSSSSKHYCSSTDDLSPGSLPGVLLLSNGTLLLEGGFTLRCLQRLSLPHFASLLCRWHDNSCTSGASTPVLSY